MAVTYDPIATTTLGSAQTSVTFSSIPGTYTDFVLVTVPAQNSGVFSQLDCIIQINGDTGSNYSRTYINGNGSSVSSSRASNANSITAGNITGNTVGNGNGIVHFMNYSNTTTYKTILSRGNFASGSVEADVFLWRSTSAITSISLKPNQIYNTEQFISGSTFTLYGIKAA